MKSNIFTLDKMDWIKGAIMAAVVPVLVIVQQSVTTGSLTFDWKAIAMAAIAGFVGYILKNLFTNSVPEAVKTVRQAGGTVDTIDAPQFSKAAAPKDVETQQGKKGL